MNVSRRFLAFLAGVLAVAFLSGCEQRPVTELHDVHWDRDMCERCKMVVSDRTHTVQVINPKDGRSYMFDDIGCAVLWFKNDKIAWASEAKIWITDADTGEWIDARHAYFDVDNITPMAYGLAAHKDRAAIKADKEVLLFDEIEAHIIKVEETFNTKSRP